MDESKSMSVDLNSVNAESKQILFFIGAAHESSRIISVLNSLKSEERNSLKGGGKARDTQ